MDYYNIESLEQYLKQYKKSVKKPEKFWAKIADNFYWDKKWEKVLDFDLVKGDIKWFEGAKTNITINCIDRHLAENADSVALIFEPNDPSEQAQEISYRELHKRVCKMANVLKNFGVKKGDRVCIYLPMISEIAIATLACARIGAVHSVVFGGFSATAVAARILDCDARIVITADGGFRGSKTIDLKGIVDEALKKCPDVRTVLVADRISSGCEMVEDRDHWIAPLMENASAECEAEMMDAEDPLFILYTSGSTGKPKGMVHTIGGYMVFVGYTFKNTFSYKSGDTFWCTADVGWITGHSYIIYGPLLNGATSVIFEGIPSFPDYGRFWQIVEKHKVNQFYTAPTAIRSLAKQGTSWPEKYDLSSLKVIGSVGEPINEEAWHWYNENIGKKLCPLIDTWWQTETGGIMISAIPFVTPTKPAFATFPLPGIQPALLDENGTELDGRNVAGSLCIKFPWPGIARTIWNDHERYRQTYFTAFPGVYFTGDGALRDTVGYYRITGRVDDVVIVSGHNLGTAPIEDAIDEHHLVAESAIVGFPDDVKGNALYGFINLKSNSIEEQDTLKQEINAVIASSIGPIAKLDRIQFVSSLPKTRSGKIMRRILRKIACEETDLGDISTLVNPEVVAQIVEQKATLK